MRLRAVLISAFACSALSAGIVYADGMPTPEDDQNPTQHNNPPPYVPPPPRPHASTAPVTKPAPAPATVADQAPAPTPPPATTTAQVTPPPPAPTPAPPPVTTPAPAPAPVTTPTPAPAPVTTPTPAPPPVTTPAPAVSSTSGNQAATGQPGPSNLKAVASIDSLQVTPSKTEKDFVTVVVQGVTKGDGWTNPQLAPRDSVPTGSTRSYTVVATPPAASKTQASTKFTASLKIMLPPDVKTIVVYSETNQESQAVR